MHGTAERVEVLLLESVREEDEIPERFRRRGTDPVDLGAWRLVGQSRTQAEH
jgi:hypothetical protein